MIPLWVVTVITVILTEHTAASNKIQLPKPSDWKIVEETAEDYPFIVALLKNQTYMCTGTIIRADTVLTSGICVKRDPNYVGVGLAVINMHINPKSLHQIVKTQLHYDYIFNMKPSNPNMTELHSNIGLVMTASQLLLAHFEGPAIGNYFASELSEQQLVAIGYGYLSDSDGIVLQRQVYHQTPCTNPKWYYCVCGFEYSTYAKTYEEEFGDGGPVMVGSNIVAIAAAPCGSLFMPNSGIKYNIFTVIGPYSTFLKMYTPYDSDPASYYRRAILDGLTDGGAGPNIIPKYICIVIALIIKFLI